ncbi:hypothetical protein AB0D78_22330 [Streptomyces avermitilis]|uniref:hypothetical protein n=1 Tax=Streptomyces avermitilis TaxID=33903 RepID=UPI0033C4EEED
MLVRRHELSAAEGELLQPLLLQTFGRPRLDDRTVVNGIYFRTNENEPRLNA